MRDLCVLFPVGKGSKKFEDWGGKNVRTGGRGGLSVRKDIMMSM